MQKNLPKRLRHLTEAAIYYCALGSLKLIPRSRRADFYGGLLGKTGPKTRFNQRILDNLDIGLPGITDGEKNRIAKGVWENLGRNYAEVTFGAALADPDQGIIKAVNIEAYKKVVDQGRGAVMVGAHFGNWELSVLYAGYVLKDFAGFYRRQNNPYMDRAINKLRTGTGATLIAKNDRQGLRKALANLRNGGSVGILMDQHMTGGDELPFLARSALTMPLVYSIAKTTGAAILPYRLKRLPDATYECIFEDEVRIDPDLPTAEARKTTLTALNATIGRWIKEDPDQWFWLHNRWRLTRAAPEY